MIPKIEEAIGRKLPSKYPEPELLAAIPSVRGEHARGDRERGDRGEHGERS